MSVATTMENRELLQVAEAVAREKGIDREAVMEAMEQAIQVAGRRKYGHELNICAEIDRKTGAMQLYREREVVEEIEDPATQIELAEAQKIEPEIELAGVIRDELPPIDFGRIAAQTAKQVVMQKVRDAERDVQFDEYKDRIGEVINGVVKRVEYGNVIVELGRVEAIIPRRDTIPREMFRQGERVRAYVSDVRRERTGPQIFLSRTHPMFMARLFAQEVPEIYDGIIEIKAVARDPGSRAKICVLSHDGNIDPVGSCVGVRGSRVQAVISELQGERIDIIQWTADPAQLAVKLLAPAEVAKVVLDENANRMACVVPEEQLSQAIGRRGQNVRLASQILGWEIDVMTEEEESTKRAEEFATVSALFIDALNVEDVIGELLAAEGFRRVEDVAYAPVEDIAEIEGFDEEIAQELIQRAKDYLTEREDELKGKWEALGVSQELADLPGMTAELMVALGEKEIKTLDDLADLAHDEFEELLPESGLSGTEVDALIMGARAHWFEDEETDKEGDEPQSGTAA